MTPPGTGVDSGAGGRALASQASAHPASRLLDVNAAAAYMGVSSWTIRDLDAAGLLPRVRIPLPGHREVRRLLYDVRDLDAAIDAWKERGQ